VSACKELADLFAQYIFLHPLTGDREPKDYRESVATAAVDFGGIEPATKF
jgi:hypothetical protein